MGEKALPLASEIQLTQLDYSKLILQELKEIKEILAYSVQRRSS